MPTISARHCDTDVDSISRTSPSFVIYDLYTMLDFSCSGPLTSKADEYGRV